MLCSGKSHLGGTCGGGIWPERWPWGTPLCREGHITGNGASGKSSLGKEQAALPLVGLPCTLEAEALGHERIDVQPWRSLGLDEASRPPVLGAPAGRASSNIRSLLKEEKTRDIHSFPAAVSGQR